MKNSKNRRLYLVLVITILTAGSACQAAIFSNDNLTLYGDFRARLEADFDSQKSSGSERSDRNRLRIRARVGMKYKASDTFSFGVRLRSGSDDSHQSPHITVVDFDDNDTGDTDFNFDKWYLKARSGGAWGWIGRNSEPFWHQNEQLWDDDVNPAGIALGYKSGAFSINAGYFSMPVGMREFSGNLGGVQGVFKSGDFTIAGGFFAIDGDSDDSDSGFLLNGNGGRDYSIWHGAAQFKFDVGGKPLALGVDIYDNAEDYSATDPDVFTAANHDQTDGWVVMARYGNLKKSGDWQLRYYYAEIETLAVNGSYVQDDWVRWGSAVETRATNMKGHEFRVSYAFAENMNLVSRLYIADAITTIEDGNRLRFDFNYKF